MAFRTQKISQMTPKGADLEATDLIEVSTIESGSYVTRSITGQELIDAIPLPPTGLTVGTTPIASGTVGRILFEGTGNVVQESSSLFWDNTNARLGIGTSTFWGSVQQLIVGSATEGRLGVSNTGRQGVYLGRVSNVSQIFAYDYASVAALPLALNSFGGNVLIGTTTDAGFRLDVNGTARVSSLTMPNFSTITSGSNSISYETVRTIFYASFNNINNQYSFNFDDGGGSTTLTSGTTGRFQLSSRFAPTSGTAVYNTFLLNATINQTGGANGITRGLYINPTLTAAADFRAIETTAGNVLFGSNFFWDNTNGRLGIGTSSPSYGIDIVGAVGAASSIRTGWGVYSRYLINPTATATWIEFQPSTHQMQFTINGTEAIRIPSTRNVLINTTTDAGYKLDVNGTARVVGTAVLGRVNFSSNDADGQLRFVGSALVYNPTGSASLSSISAAFEIQSTTQGFLPPRMTNAQMVAIATPAAGLQVYDTTNNKMCVYDGTTWQNLY